MYLPGVVDGVREVVGGEGEADGGLCPALVGREARAFGRVLSHVVSELSPQPQPPHVGWVGQEEGIPGPAADHLCHALVEGEGPAGRAELFGPDLVAAQQGFVVGQVGAEGPALVGPRAQEFGGGVRVPAFKHPRPPFHDRQDTRIVHTVGEERDRPRDPQGIGPLDELTCLNDQPDMHTSPNEALCPVQIGGDGGKRKDRPFAAKPVGLVLRRSVTERM